MTRTQLFLEPRSAQCVLTRKCAVARSRKSIMCTVFLPRSSTIPVRTCYLQFLSLGRRHFLCGRVCCVVCVLLCVSFVLCPDPRPQDLPPPHLPPQDPLRKTPPPPDLPLSGTKFRFFSISRHMFALFPLGVRGSYSARVPRSSLAEVHREFVHHILEDEVDGQKEGRVIREKMVRKERKNGVIEGRAIRHNAHTMRMKHG